MKLYIDHREDSYIIDQLKFWHTHNYHDFEIEVKILDVGDYLCGNCIVERKSLEDFIKSVRDGLIYKQCNDLLYNTELNPYVVICSRSRDFELFGYNMWDVYATISRLNKKGIPTLMVDNEDYFVTLLINLMKIHNSENEEHYINPVRRPISLSDKVQTTYSTIPSVGRKLAERLHTAFPIPEQLFQCNIQQLMAIEGISKKKAKIIFEYIHGGK